MRSPESSRNLELEPNAELAARMENRARGVKVLQVENAEIDHNPTNVVEKAKSNFAFKAFISGMATLSAAASIFSTAMTMKQASDNAHLNAKMIEAQNNLSRIDQEILEQISKDISNGKIQSNEQAQKEADEREIPIEKAPTGGQELEDTLADLGISSTPTPEPSVSANKIKPRPVPTPPPYKW